MQEGGNERVSESKRLERFLERGSRPSYLIFFVSFVVVIIIITGVV